MSTVPGSVTPVEAPVMEPVEKHGRAPRLQSLHALVRRPMGFAAAVFLTLLVIASLAAPWFAPYDPGKQNLSDPLAGPQPGHWLGTDQLGRDVLSRLFYGGRITLLSVAEAVTVFVALGVSLGLVAGFVGGWTDRVITRIADLLLALPGIVVLLMVLSVFPNNNFAAMVALGVIGCPTLLRVVRGLTLGLRQELYVKAARLAGSTGPRIMRRHILPRLAGPIVVQVSLFCATAALVQAALSYLGLSTPDTGGPSWGNMVGEASQVISQQAWLLIPTGGVIALTVLAFGLLGDAVRDIYVGRSLAPAVAEPQRVAPQTSRPLPRPQDDDSPSTALLSVRGLTVAFPAGDQDVTVVQDVTFSVEPGEAVGIVGESGCGKTITARSLIGLLPGSGKVTAGSAVFDGTDLLEMTEQERALVQGRRIGLVSQEPMAGLDPSFRVGSQLAEVIRQHTPMTRRQAWTRAGELLGLVRLPDPERAAHSYPHELSGGMAQRVAIALALAGDPALLIADEPTTALDVTVQGDILALLSELQERLGMAIILVTHDWGVLASLCDRAIVMYAGEVVEQAPVGELFRAPRHPYTKALLAANPHVASPGDVLPAIPGTVPPPSAWPVGCHFQARCRFATEACGTGPIGLNRLSPHHEARCIHSDRLAES